MIPFSSAAVPCRAAGTRRAAVRAAAAALAAAVSALVAGPAPGQDFMGSLDPTQQKPGVSTSVSYRLYPEAEFKGSGLEAGIGRTSFRLSALPWKDGNESFSVSASGGLFRVDTAEPMPGGIGPFPARLWTLSAGLGAQTDVGRGCVAGGNVNVASSSDDPFGSFDETGFSVSLHLRIPQGDSAWLVFLYYGSSGGELSRIPFPSVGFFWKPCEEFQALLGAPFLMLNWRPSKLFMLNFSYFPITSVRLRAMCFLLALLIHAGVSFTNEGFYPAGRRKKTDQLLYYQKEATVGATLFAGRGAMLSFTAGFAFDREFRMGAAFWGDYERLPLRNGAFVSFEASFRFS